MNRRILCALLALVMCLSLIACGKKQTAPAATEDKTAAVNPTAEANQAAEATEPQKTEQQGAEAPASNAQAETEEAPAFQPGVDTTLPPEVEASLGVEEDDTPAIDDDTIDSQSPEATTPAPQPSEEESQIGEDFDLRSLTYEGYHALSGADQKKVIAMFGSADDFMLWYSAVEAQYKAQHPEIEIGEGGIVDAGNLGG